MGSNPSKMQEPSIYTNKLNYKIKFLFGYNDQKLWVLWHVRVKGWMYRHGLMNLLLMLKFSCATRLVAALSRDLLVDFIPFLLRIADSLASPLQGGADREPEIIEQIFISWSYIMMYLQKYLIRDLVYLLKVTVKLRFYPKDYVQEFMAEALSFLLRNAPDEQLQKLVKCPGERDIRIFKLLSKYIKDPLLARKFVDVLLPFVAKKAKVSCRSVF
ncbi:U3 small nucleolar RNA-associated protein 20-like isoform X4 [Juglans regia]|uniref:U3 small nucleolar RNA-associated protein 20-like isoform X4 n=1 Tax=Juglans regia TaxID=51240 RepID=A0A6P9EDM7_JUGRE|nr:U3 small nucleolar RNA-associated protein 20-like isoform X4 [Juglans regia]